MNNVPDGYKNKDEYELEEAITVWAYVMYDRPMNLPPKERNAWSVQYSSAKSDLRKSGCLQRKEWTTMEQGVGPIGGIETRWSEERHPPRPVKHVREWFRGTDLAKYAAGRGKPGVFGFAAEQPDKGKWGFEHDTAMLKLVRWVVARFWEGAEPKEWPNKEDVKKELVVRFPDLKLSSNELEAIDLVTRHDKKRNKGR